MNMVSAISLFVGGLCWVASLFFPALVLDTGQSVMGYWVLLTGWMGVTFFQFAWIANLLIVLAVVLMYRFPIRSTLAAALALLIATQAFWLTEIPGHMSNNQVISHGMGYWLWYFSILCIGLGVVLGADENEPAKDVVTIKEPKPENDPLEQPLQEAIEEITPKAANDEVLVAHK